MEYGALHRKFFRAIHSRFISSFRINAMLQFVAARVASAKHAQVSRSDAWTFCLDVLIYRNITKPFPHMFTAVGVQSLWALSHMSDETVDAFFVKDVAVLLKTLRPVLKPAIQA